LGTLALGFRPVSPGHAQAFSQVSPIVCSGGREFATIELNILRAFTEEEMRTQTRELVFGAHQMTIVCRAAPSEAADQEATPNADDWVVDGDDSSGLDIWPAATALCEYLLRCQQQLVGPSTKVIELGAGAGVPGLLTARMGAEVVLTDFDPNALELAVRNTELNDLLERCSVESLDFYHIAPSERTDDAESPRPTHLFQRFSLALATDILYASAMVKPVLEAAAFVLQSGGVLLIGHQPRFTLILNRASGDAQVEQRDTPWEDFLELSRARGYHNRCLGKYHCAENREPTDVLVYAVSTAEATLAMLPALT